MNSDISERTLLRLANVPQMKMKIFEVNLQKPFSRVISFVWSLMQLRRLQEIEAAITFSGLSPQSFWSKIVVSPPVVAVSDRNSSRRRT